MAKKQINKVNAKEGSEFLVGVTPCTSCPVGLGTAAEGWKGPEEKCQLPGQQAS